MGKGDKKTRRGKIYRGTYGKARSKKRPSQRGAKGAAAGERRTGGAAGGARGR